MCDCITTVDKLLAQRNAKLGVTFNLLTGQTFPKLEVEKLEPRNKQKPPLMIPSYCPFCGEPYRRETVADSE